MDIARSICPVLLGYYFSFPRRFSAIMERNETWRDEIGAGFAFSTRGRFAAGGTHETETADGLCGAAASRGSGEDALEAHRRGQDLLDDLLGAAGRRQDDLGTHHRRRDEGAVHRLFRRDERHQGDPHGHAGGREEHGLRRADDPLRR